MAAPPAAARSATASVRGWARFTRLALRAGPGLAAAAAVGILVGTSWSRPAR